MATKKRKFKVPTPPRVNKRTQKIAAGILAGALAPVTGGLSLAVGAAALGIHKIRKARKQTETAAKSVSKSIKRTAINNAKLSKALRKKKKATRRKKK